MNTQQQPQQRDELWVDIVLVVAGLLLAWPALVLGLVVRGLIKQHVTEPTPYWIGAGALGAMGAVFLVTRANPYPFVLVVEHDLVPLVLHLSMTTVMRLLHDALPVWERSLLVFPWFMLVMELFRPRNLHTTLLARERQRRVLQARKSRRAARNATKAPDQIKGQAVLGVLIDDPNHSPS